MTVVVQYRSGRTEIVSFKCADPFPQRIRMRRIISRVGGPECDLQETIFARRWSPRGRPIYVEEVPAEPKGAA